MKKSVFFIAAAIFCAAVCAGFTACTASGAHEHTYSEDWAFDKTYHWHAATCGHTDETSGKAKHVFEGDVCAVCGYSAVSTGLEYRLNADGNGYVVAGRGTAAGDIVIPAEYNDLPVTAIGRRAFEDASIKSVTIPFGVTDIEGSAFMGCDALQRVVIPESVTSIGASAFSGCAALAEIDLPSGIGTIENYTFSGYVALTGITIPAGVTRIEKSAFEGCASLTDITIPDCVSSIGNSAFFNCGSLENVTMGVGITRIESWAFRECASLGSIVYAGTREQWNAVEKEFMWDRDTVGYTVYCADGEIAY